MLKFQICVYKVSNKYLIIFLNVLQIRRLCFHAASCSSVSLTWTSCLRAETHQDAELILLSFNFTGFMFQRWNLWDVCFWCSLCDCSELCALCLFVAFPQHLSCITALLCWVHAVSRLKDESPLYSSGVSCGASIRSTVLNQWTVLETRRRAALIHSYIQNWDKVEARRCNQEPPHTERDECVFEARVSCSHYRWKIAPTSVALFAVSKGRCNWLESFSCDSWFRTKAALQRSHVPESYRLMMLSVTLLIHSCAFNKDVTCCESQLSSDAAECSWITSESK